MDAQRSARHVNRSTPSPLSALALRRRCSQIRAAPGTRGADESGPLSGRSSSRRGGSAMGAYGDFASRMHAADSQRSQRSQRSYRG